MSSLCGATLSNLNSGNLASNYLCTEAVRGSVCERAVGVEEPPEGEPLEAGGREHMNVVGLWKGGASRCIVEGWRSHCWPLEEWSPEVLWRR